MRKAVLNAIRKMGDLTGKKLAAAKTEISQGTDPQKRIYLIQQETEKLKREKMEIYEQYSIGYMDKLKFLSAKAELDDKLSSLLQESENIAFLLSEGAALDTQIKKAADYSARQELTAEMVSALVKEVRIYKDDRIEIVWNFSSIFKKY